MFYFCDKSLDETKSILASIVSNTNTVITDYDEVTECFLEFKDKEYYIIFNNIDETIVFDDEKGTTRTILATEETFNYFKGLLKEYE